MSREQLNQEVWGGGLEPHSNTPEVYVSYLRRRFASASCDPIRTVRGLGYILTSEPRRDRRLRAGGPANG